MYKTTNHLGSLTDKLAKSGQSVPSLNQQLSKLQQTTQELQEVLKGCLPEDILQNCWVVTQTNEQLTLAVTSTTAANHLNYLKENYLQVLIAHSTNFSQLKQLKIILVNLPKSN